MKRLIVVGGGISGVYLSIVLKKKMGSDIDVIVLEQNSSSLKKLLATGNGRCNLSNQDMKIDYYQSDRLDIVEKIISEFDIYQEMFDLGLLCQYQGHLLYPKSEQALSVKRVFDDEAQRLGVLFIYEQEVIKILQKERYIVKTNLQDYHTDYVVLAMGSEAGKLSGINPSRYQILKSLGLKVIEPTPSLVQMNTKPVLKSLKGVRVKGTFSLLEKGKCIHKEKGELLFTDYGVSGIAVMQLSAYYQKGHQYEISLDLFDDTDEKNLIELIANRLNKDYNHFYDGLLNSKLSSYFEKMNLTSPEDIAKILKDMRLKVTGLRSYETAQVMKGGLSMEDVNDSLELNKYPHIYAIGEILNVTGLCGGYNIHFALASAMHVANAIEREFYAKNS